jgi:hypothetical protein
VVWKLVKWVCSKPFAYKPTIGASRVPESPGQAVAPLRSVTENFRQEVLRTWATNIKHLVDHLASRDASGAQRFRDALDLRQTF